MRTLYNKLWDAHVVHEADDGTTLLYIDRQLLHEVSSAQPFHSMKSLRREPWRRNANVAMADHNVPTTSPRNQIADPNSLIQIEALTENCKANHILLFDVNDRRQGIVHVVGPELGLTLPGMTLVCGDSHTSTHGALGALAFGIGVSEVEAVLTTQCLLTKRSRTLLVDINGQLPAGISPKDLTLTVVNRLGIGGGRGYAIEYAGEAVRNLSIEGRMTLCNMTIEAGARSGLIGADDKTIDYIRGRRYAPQGELWDRAVASWRECHSDPGARFDSELHIDAAEVEPMVTWGTVPDMSVSVHDVLPDPASEDDPQRKELYERAYRYMALEPGTPVSDITLDKIFIGSCTNGRIEDLRAAAKVVSGKRIASNIRLAMVVPGSTGVKIQAEREGLDQIFRDAGFEWRESGCSMCLAMNADRLLPGERCASTSNRNFEGRQGTGGRTHLVSPEMAAAAAIAGHFVDVREELR